jgi:hypothetical protein
VANTFDQQARERFTASLKFMQKAEALLEDDLIYRSALADAVSAIKNMLQGYLLLRIAHTPPSGVTQQWQEAAISNGMPDLIAACGEAGLDLRGLAVDIRRLNNERNNRAHDDPQRQIEADQASHAIETARTLQRRIKASVEGKSEARSLPAMATQAVQVARAAVSGQLARKGASGVATSAQAADNSTGNHPRGAGVLSRDSEAVRAATAGPPTPSVAAAALAAADADDGGEARDTDEMPSLAPRRRGRQRRGSILWRALLAATLVIAGIVLGAGLTVPVARGNAPSWLGFASRFLAPTPTPTASTTPTATPSAAPVVLNTGQTIGALVVGPITCTPPALVLIHLTNTGATSSRWAVASTDMPGARFAASAGAAEAAGGASLVGSLAPGAQTAIYVGGIGAGTGHVALVATGGAAVLTLGACDAGG